MSLLDTLELWQELHLRKRQQLSKLPCLSTCLSASILLLPNCICFSCCSPIASVSVAAPRLQLHLLHGVSWLHPLVEHLTSVTHACMHTTKIRLTCCDQTLQLVIFITILLWLLPWSTFQAPITDQVPTPLFWLKLLHRVESERIKGPPITCSKRSLCSKGSYLIDLLGYALAQVKVKCCMVCVCVCVCVCMPCVCTRTCIMWVCVWTMGPVDFCGTEIWDKLCSWESPLFRCM